MVTLALKLIIVFGPNLPKSYLDSEIEELKKYSFRHTLGENVAFKVVKKYSWMPIVWIVHE